MKIEEAISNAFDILSSRHNAQDGIDCILKLLVLKKLSDLPEAQQNHKEILISDKARWKFIRNNENIRNALQNASLDIKQKNPNLEALFIESDSEYWDKFSDEILNSLFDLFSMIDFSESSSGSLKEISLALEALLSIDRLESSSNYTPNSISEIMIRVISPERTHTICDPECGSGSILTSAFRHALEGLKDQSNKMIYGQSSSHRNVAIANASLILQGYSEANIKLGNSLTKPAFPLNKFDCVVCNPPFNIKLSKKEITEIVELERFPYGIPRNRNANFLFIQNILSLLSSTGKATVIQPGRVLSCEGDEKLIRENLVKDDVIEAIIQLPEKLFYRVSIPANIIFINKDKTDKRKGKIIFVDASNEYVEGRKQNWLSDENINEIVSIVRNFKDIEGSAKVVGIQEISDNFYDLGSYRYISYPREAEIDPVSEVSKLRKLEAERSVLARDIDECLRVLGIDI